MRLEKRPQVSHAALLLAPVVAVAFTLAVSGLLVLWAGAPVGRTYVLLAQGASYPFVVTLSRCGWPTPQAGRIRSATRGFIFSAIRRNLCGV